MKSTKIAVVVTGIRPIMFDRFVSMKAKLAPEKKVYVEDGVLVLPAKNIMSFLSGVNTESAPQRTMGKKWRTIAKAAMSFVDITPDNIRILRDGKPCTVEDTEKIRDKAVVKKGQLAVPSEKIRPMLPLPWSMSFGLELYQNEDLNESILRELFEDGGITIGFGTYRGVYGKFIVEKWEIEK